MMKQKENRADVCLQLLEQANYNETLEQRIITGGDSWVYATALRGKLVKDLHA